MTSVDYPETGHDWCAAVEDASWWFRHRNRFLLEVMRRYPPAQPFYDVGGGNGVVASALRDAGIPAVVVEPGEAGAARARARGLDAIRATLDTAGIAAGSAGAIGIFDVLEHIEEPSSFLANARSLLRSGGRLYVTVPAYRALWSAEDEYAQHYRRYTAAGLRRALDRAGFDVELTTYMFALLPLPILLLRAIPYRLGRARAFTADGVSSDHRSSGLGSRVLGVVLESELAVFRRTGALPFGGSVVGVAKKRV